MAVTITRTPWIDDDGTGTTGTVINNAVKTALYNDIDGGFAKLAQLAGGNTFSGTQALGGNLTVNGNGTVNGILQAGLVQINTTTDLLNGVATILADGANRNGISIRNINAANTIYFVAFYNSASGLAGGITQSGASAVVYSTTSDARLKHDHGRADDLTALRGVVVHDFTWRADGVYDRGVFAQEAHALYPRAVSQGTDHTTEDGMLTHPWMTDYSKFVPDLIVGWQHHDAALTELRARVAALTGLPE
jgi:hypothetical protein